MQLSTLIEELQAILEKEGDLIVRKSYSTEEEAYTSDEVVDVCSYRQGRKNIKEVFISDPLAFNSHSG